MVNVYLRRKPLKGNKLSLYLDIYPPIPHPETGKLTRRHFLGLHIYKNPKTDIEKNHNKETLALAEAIRAKRQLEVQAEQYGFLAKKKPEKDFLEFFKEQNNGKRAWHATLKHLQVFTNGKLPTSKINEAFCNDFREYLLELNLSKNSASLYFSVFKTALKKAYKAGLLAHDFTTNIESIKMIETQREYLTINELQALAKTECRNKRLKDAALFSALTGLRVSDILKLTWSEVQGNESEGYTIKFRQQKTKGYEYIPISKQAYELLGERKDPDTRVFAPLKYSHYLNLVLREWVLLAGIKKKITFHCFRHTFATLQLSMGTDIYTVSKMLGHRELATTQIYAKIIDENKRKAAEKIKLDM